MEPGKIHQETEKAKQTNLTNLPASQQAKQTLELRRNFYERSGKDLSTDIVEKQTNGNGEEKTPNGNSVAGLTTKQIDDIAKDNKKPTYCSSCGIDCSKLNYHYVKDIPAESKISSLDVCLPCMADGHFPSTTQAADYVRQEDPDFNKIPDGDTPWTDAEILRLLEALEKFDEDWNEIAQHVRTRTREECVVKFLQLEIEDQYLEPELSGPSYQGVEAGRVPFTQGDNPVLSVLGFLTSLSEPSVAAAAGGRAIEEQTKKMRKRLENGMGGSPSDKDKELQGGVREDEMMELDDVESPKPSQNNQVALTETPDSTKGVANTIFAAAGARAAALASHEEREMTRLVSAAVNTTLKKFELKLAQFQEMEMALQAGRRELDRGRQQLFLDRLAFRRRVIETQEALQRAALTSGEEGARMAQDVTVGGQEKVTFEAAGTAEKLANLQPLSAGTPGYSSHEI